MPEHRRFRNPVARSPLLRKGGPHQRSRSGERRQLQQALDAELDAWFDESEERQGQAGAPVPKGTGSRSYRASTAPHLFPSFGIVAI